jgi:hypothetical protein
VCRASLRLPSVCPLFCFFLLLCLPFRGLMVLWFGWSAGRLFRPGFWGGVLWWLLSLLRLFAGPVRFVACPVGPCSCPAFRRRVASAAWPCRFGSLAGLASAGSWCARPARPVLCPSLGGWWSARAGPLRCAPPGAWCALGAARGGGPACSFPCPAWALAGGRWAVANRALLAVPCWPLAWPRLWPGWVVGRSARAPFGFACRRVCGSSASAGCWARACARLWPGVRVSVRRVPGGWLVSVPVWVRGVSGSG